jgi:hypothetical protein
MESKDRIVKLLNKKLNPTEKQLFTLVKIENRKDGLTFRMPIGLISLEGVWEKIQECGTELNIKCYKAGEFATLDELDSLLGDIQWLWEGWIPKGFVTMLAGDPGRGKSAIMQHFIKIITEGTAFPLQDEPLASKGNAIWIDTEASQQILKVRAGLMDIDKKKVFLPVINGDILSQANLGFPEDREQIINLIEGVQPEILVLDSLGGSHSRGENKVEEIRPVLEFLALLARDYAMAVAVVHHLNKSKDGESTEVSLYRIRGSTVIPAYCRSIIALERASDSSNILKVIKSNLALQSDPILVTPVLGDGKNISGFEYQPYKAPPTRQNKKDLCAAWVRQTLTEANDSVPLSQLIDKGESMGYTRGNIYSARDILGDQITFSGTGNKAMWQITRVDNKMVNTILQGKNGKEKGNNSNVKRNKK